MRKFLLNISFQLFIILSFTLSLLAQNPVDCIDAIPICNSTQLNYNSNGSGANDFGSGSNDNSNGCLLSDEHQSAWFEIYISPTSPPNATLAFDLTPSAGFGEDYDFALYGPNVGCDGLGNPIRCSFADENCSFCPQTGLGMGAIDFTETFTGDGYVAEVITQPGESYILLVDNWLSSSQGFFLDWTGTAILSCACTTDAAIEGELEICEGESTELTATGSDLVDFQWQATAGGNISGPANMESVTATSPGTYTVTVSDSEGCTGTASVEVTQAPGPDITASVDPATCGQENGGINISNSGGAPPYTFAWSDGSVTEDLTNLSPGNYTVTVTSADGCSSEATFEIMDESPPLDVNGTVTNNTDCLSGNGSINTNVNPPGSYSYTWSNGESTGDITDLPPGTYTVTVTSTGTCSGTASFTVGDNPGEPEIIPVITPSVCDLSNGEIDISVTGTAPFDYAWSSGATSQDLQNLLPGSYSVTVTAGNGCTAVADITVPNDNPPISITADIAANTSCALPNGSISVEVFPSPSPSGEPYTYTWPDGSTTPDLTDLSPGDYTLTVSGGGSCTQEISFTVDDEPQSPVVEANITNAICGGANGAIQVTATGGIQPYTYLWDDGTTTPDLPDLNAGTYGITVTGENGCTTEESFTVEDEQLDFSVNAAITPNTLCTADGNGSIALTVTPAGTYSLLWNTGETEENLNNLLSGAYTLTISAGGTCEQELSFTVADAPDLPEVSAEVEPSVCNEPIGEITLVPISGQQPFTYLWSGGETTQSISGLLPGTYSVTITGSNECTSVVDVIVPNDQVDIEILENISPNTSCDGGNGSIHLTITPSQGLSFQWSNGETTEDLENLDPGTYFLTVTGGGDCEITQNFTVPDDISQPEVSLLVGPATCGQANGSIDLSVAAGEEPYNFSWSSGDFFEDLSGLYPGSYSVTVTDALGCTAISSTIINNNTISIDISGFSTPNSSCEGANGEVNISIEPPESYIYSWSNGEAIEDLSGLEAGEYTVTVTLGDICTATATFNVENETEEPTASAQVTPAICGEDDGAIDLTVEGGLPPYTFAWSNGETFEDITDLFSGSYMVTVYGSNNCFTVLPVNVPNNSSSFTISGNISPVTSCLENNGAIDLTVSPPGSYEFQWSNGMATEDIESLEPGDYTVTVTQAGSCNGSMTFTVVDDTSLPAFSLNSTNDTCGLETGSIYLTEIDGMIPLTFLWSNGPQTQDIHNLSAGNYTVTVTDVNGCSSASSAVVGSFNPEINISGTTTDNSSCSNPNGTIDVTISPAGNYTFAWSNGEESEDLNGLSAGSYSLTVNSGECSAQATFSIGSDVSDVTLSASITDAVCYESSDGEILLIPEGGLGPYSYDWAPPIAGLGANPVGLDAGEYHVTVTDQEGCSVTGMYVVSEPDQIAISCSQSSNVSSPGASDGIANIELAGGTPPYQVSWDPGTIQDDVMAGIFVIPDLEEGEYQVEVVDANGCKSTCTFIITSEACVTEAGEMDLTPLQLCGEVCVTAQYDANGELLNEGEGVQFILHQGTSMQIEEVISQSDAPEFCFNPSVMIFGQEYFITAIAGIVDANGNVDLQAACTSVSKGVPVIFYEIPLASIQDPDQIDCENTEIDLIGSSSIPTSGYAWFSEVGNIVSDPNAATITVDRGGHYDLVVTSNICKDTAGVEVAESDDIPALEIGPVGELNCRDSVVVLYGSTAYPGANLQWARISGGDTTTLGTTDSLLVTEAGSYYLIGTAPNGCQSSRQVIVEEYLNIPGIDAGFDLTLDCGQPEILIQPVASENIIPRWFNLDMELISEGSLSLLVQEPGTYIIEVVDIRSLCSATDEVEVLLNDDLPVSHVELQPVSCAGEEDAYLLVTPEGGTGPFTFFLNGNDMGNNGTFSNLGPGEYFIEVLDAGGCLWTEEVEILHPEPVQLEIGSDITVSPGESTTIELTTNLFPEQIESIIWSTDPQQEGECQGLPCTEISYDFLSPATVNVTLSDTNGCFATDALSVYISEEQKVFVPNIFSPNGDGQNDMFTLFADSGVHSIRHLRIYTRWGEMLFEKRDFLPNDPSLGWNGEFRGRKIDPGVFVWEAEVVYQSEGSEILFGNVTMVR